MMEETWDEKVEAWMLEWSLPLHGWHGVVSDASEVGLV